MIMCRHHRDCCYPILLSLLLVCIPLATKVVVVSAAPYGDKTTYSTGGKQTTVRRERNLDHWDSDTLAYYLDEDYPGYDVAIMFYAQWDSNSHSLAPYWDRIATILEAGSSQSKLVMSLFDCELNDAHTQLCEAAGVTHYPTLLFVGSGPFYDTDPITSTLLGKKKSAGPVGDAPVPNTVKFQGNWQYGDAILDWIRTMQALSRWHVWSTQGFGRRLRAFFLPSPRPGKDLPIGIPGRRKNIAAGVKKVGGGEGVGASDASDSFEIGLLKAEVAKLNNQTQDLANAIARSDSMLERVLLPESDESEDVFAVLDKTDGWNNKTATTAMDEVLRSCVKEVSLDYCQRIGTKVTSDFVDELQAEGKTLEEMLEMENLEEQVVARYSALEPYCGILEECLLEDMAKKECRPTTCPFQNPNACKYLTSCLGKELQDEYAAALGLSLETESSSGDDGTDDAKPEKKKRWF